MPTGEQPASGALALLRTNPEFRRLTTARVVSFVGDSLSLVALMLHVAATTGQALAVAALLLVGDFGPALLSPISGAFSDRFDRRHVMVVCELVQAALLVAIAVALPPLPLLLVLVGLRAWAGQVFQPASRASIPALVRGRDLESANSTLGFGANAAEAIGPLLAAAMVPLLGVRGVLLVDAASFLVSALLLVRLPALPPTSEPDGSPAPRLLAQAREGLGYIWSVRSVRIIALGFFAVVAANGIDDVALLVLATETFGAGESAVGLLLAAVGIGLLIGYALLTWAGTRLPMVALLVSGFAVSSVGNLLTGLAWAVAAAFTVQLLRGIGIAAMDVASNTLLQRLVPDRMLGRVFGNLYGAIGVAAGISYIGGGLLLDATSAPTTFLVAGAAGTLAAIAVAVTLPRAVRAEW
ncbi:Predicted arabinose efflux permease, MFS family [Geodermatophilus sabuli]|uniref:Predicted arabinose efflux permease, MFS family n=1 Tax=Geodermatophilus sabuli TaxID=1564158 RepID=A0A285EDZ3_9ACTN|nr:Predicted arabinose efflux permease, MFS family [Geodermatophilus sabuli]